MKKLLTLSLVVLLAFSATNCEKDDICDANTMTTPRLIVEFYDADNPTVLQNVTNLKIIGEGLAEDFALGTFNNVSKVMLPLKTTDDITQYRFILYSTDTDLANEDKIQINYTRDNLFVSRACGYKTVFDLTGFTYTDPVDPAQLWIRSVTINQTNINSEDETHVSILF
ncbi:MAG TPA: DUF6452 family protein [Flavobacterium sp.]|nr:DUF6452 family protein [Flavobacterium sp.]